MQYHLSRVLAQRDPGLCLRGRTQEISVRADGCGDASRDAHGCFLVCMPICLCGHMHANLPVCGCMLGCACLCDARSRVCVSFML